MPYMDGKRTQKILRIYAFYYLVCQKTACTDYNKNNSASYYKTEHKIATAFE